MPCAPPQPTTIDGRHPPRAWVTVALLWLVVCSNYVARLMITTMRGSMVETIPMSAAQFGLLTSAFLVVYGALQPFAGYLGDRFSRSRVIVCSMIVWSAVTALTACAGTFRTLLAMRILMGVGEALYMPAALALIVDYHRGPTRSLATGVHMAGMYVGCSLAGLGGWLAETHGWQYAFGIIGMAGLAYGCVLIFVLRDAPREAGGAAVGAAAASPPALGAAVRDLFGRPAFVLMLAFYSLLGMAIWLILGWLPVFVQGQFHLRQGAAGWSASGFLNLAAIPGVVLGGVWADRWIRRRFTGCFRVPFLGLLIAAPSVWVACQTGSFPVAMVGLTLYGLTVAFTQANVMPMLCAIVDPRHRATAYGVLNLGNQIGGGLAIYAAGVLMDAHVSLGAMLAGTACVLVLCALLLLAVDAKLPAAARQGTPG